MNTWRPSPLRIHYVCRACLSQLRASSGIRSSALAASPRSRILPSLASSSLPSTCRSKSSNPPRHPALRGGRMEYRGDLGSYLDNLPDMQKVVHDAIPGLHEKFGSDRTVEIADFCMEWLLTCENARSARPTEPLHPQTLLTCVRKTFSPGADTTLEAWEDTLLIVCRLMMNGSRKIMLKRAGERLLRTMSSAGSAVATVRVMASAWRRAQHDPSVLRQTGLASTMAHLKRLAAQYQDDPQGDQYQALVLQGKIDYLQGKSGAALQLWWKACDAAKSYYKTLLESGIKTHDVYQDARSVGHLSTPWNDLTIAHNALAHHYAKTRNLEEADRHRRSAEKANELGCELDDPLAHFNRAEYVKSDWDWETDMPRTWSPEYLYHMTKAAASGHLQAAYRLAQFYFLAAWPYFKNEPPDAIKPTPFDRSPPKPGTKKREPTAAEEMYFTAVQPECVSRRLSLALQWLNIPIDYYYPPAFLLAAEALLSETFDVAMAPPESAVRMLESRYTHNNPDNIDYSATQENPGRDSITAKWLVTGVCEAIATVRWELDCHERSPKALERRLRTLKQTLEEDEAYYKVEGTGGSDMPRDIMYWFRWPEVRRSWIQSTPRLESEVRRICEEQGWNILYSDNFKDVVVYKDGRVTDTIMRWKRPVTRN